MDYSTVREKEQNLPDNVNNFAKGFKETTTLKTAFCSLNRILAEVG